mmetsp:Transcript_7153/g.6241  ORF Transcript_7153/g.6241 Transcript_7153/m.6241 type:complete len:86 (-) Transcript_7153:1160-1417(-)
MYFLEQKYKSDMEEPALKLQSIVKQTKQEKESKQEYLVNQLRNKITRVITVLQAFVRAYQSRKKTKMHYLLMKIQNQRKDAAITI